MEEFSYRIIRSGRKTLSLEVTREGEIIVRAPQSLPGKRIEEFVQSRQNWIREKLQLQQNRAEAHPYPEGEHLTELARRAEEILPDRVRYYAAVMGVVPTGMSITAARTRFGSCSPKNRICFSCLLMDYPPEAIDYVVVHELAHIRHHNHSREFWAFVERFMPDYRQRRELLKQ